MADSHRDRWLHPRQQTEYPALGRVAEHRLHGRREATFLVLAAVFLVTVASLIVLGTSRTIDPSSVLAVFRPDLALPIAMRIPLGVLPFALGCMALTLVCELYGRRRAAALVGSGLIAALALAGLMHLADRVDGSAAMFVPALGVAAGYLVLHLIYVPLFDALRWRTAGRHLWLRLLVLSLVAQLVGWATFGVATYAAAGALGPAAAASPDSAAIIEIATGAALYTLAVIALLTLPVALVARGLARFLRVARHDDDGLDDTDDADDADEAEHDEPIELTRRRLPRAQVVEDGDAAADAAIDDEQGALASRPRRRAVQSTIQPFSSAEMRFFQEGDQLFEPAD